jgi:hypothetical protein
MTTTIGKWLIFIGIGIVILGLLFFIAGKIGIPLGNLPGDLKIEKKKYSIYFPIVTCVLISIFLTLIINLIVRLLHK